VKHPRAQPILAKLIGKADVLVQNLAPGAAARLGLDYEALREQNPRLIVCDISGYGADGHYRDKKAYDLLIQSESGFLSVTGTPDQPSKAGCSIADISAGMYACNNILAALISRGKTDHGRRIDLSMLECMAEWMSNPLYYAFDGAEPPPRAGASHATIYPYGPFDAGVGKSIMLGLQNEREWAIFCDQIIERPDLIADPRFSTNSRRSGARAELTAIVTAAFSQLTSAQVIDRLDRVGIANARMNDMHDLWAHPQLKERSRWIDVETPAGSIPALLPPGMMEARMDAVPCLGEHTAAILHELGYNDEAIASLRAEAAI
jgi:itaconate CoA-transferase